MSEELNRRRAAWRTRPEGIPYARCAGMPPAVEHAIMAGYIEELERELARLRAFKRSVEESLNSGDGSYRP